MFEVSPEWQLNPRHCAQVPSALTLLTPERKTQSALSRRGAHNQRETGLANWNACRARCLRLPWKCATARQSLNTKHILTESDFRPHSSRGGFLLTTVSFLHWWDNGPHGHNNKGSLDGCFVGTLGTPLDWQHVTTVCISHSRPNPFQTFEHSTVSKDFPKFKQCTIFSISKKQLHIPNSLKPHNPLLHSLQGVSRCEPCKHMPGPLSHIRAAEVLREEHDARLHIARCGVSCADAPRHRGRTCADKRLLQTDSKPTNDPSTRQTMTCSEISEVSSGMASETGIQEG